jgi:hypothetical protein
VPKEFVRVETKDDGVTLRLIPGIESAMRQCIANGQMLHESGLLPWTTPAGTRDLRNYSHFAGPKT